jgi:hypothetical protein
MLMLRQLLAAIESASSNGVCKSFNFLGDGHLARPNGLGGIPHPTGHTQRSTVNCTKVSKVSPDAR